MIEQEAVNRQAEQRLAIRKTARQSNIRQVAALKKKTSKGFDKTFNLEDIDSVTRVAERARRLGFSESAAELERDPSDRAIGQRVFEQILGANNLLGVTFLTEGARMSQAVGRIVLPVTGGRRLGTGFMVSSRIMMTNNHVLGDPLEAGNATLEFDFFEREDGNTGPVARFRLQPDAFFITDAPLDFTLVAVEASNSDGIAVGNRGFFPLIGQSGKAVVGERVSVIQHPNGDPQKVVVHDNQVSDVNPDDDFLHYQADTMGGSSGSPVLNINWDLAALHHAAVGNDNEGIRISSIVARLREIFANEAAGLALDEELRAELMSPGKPWRADDDVPVHRAAAANAEGPRVNPDGTVSWVVPISVTLGVGQLPAPQIDVSQTHSRTGRDAPEQPREDSDLRDAVQALEDTEGRVYYSKVKDDQARADYYPSLDGLSKTAMYNTLSELLRDTHTTTLSYKKARLNHLYPWIDRREDSSRSLKGIYSNKTFDALELIRQEVQAERARERAIQERMRLESLDSVDEAFLESLEAAHPFNCEHVVPQSWFAKRKQPKTDLHHLFTCEWGCNSFRGNRAYFDFDTEAFRDDCGRIENSKFEPKRGKGAVARATLYFLLRYPGDIADSAKEMPKDRLERIIKWAKDDKVDRWERHRNAEIQKIQGNRNPLIDFPELVDKIDFKRGWA